MFSEYGSCVLSYGATMVVATIEHDQTHATACEFDVPCTDVNCGEHGTCADFSEFTAMSAPLNEACCTGPGADCTMGIPSSCPGNCAAVLLPLRVACADFLKSDGAMFKSLIDGAAEQCAEAPAPQAGGAELCKPGGRPAADGGSHGSRPVVKPFSCVPVSFIREILHTKQTGAHDNDFTAHG
jgi:hypothetical protein